jgi:putative ABC transport system permease protein
MTLTIRTHGDAGALTPLLAREVHALDRDQPIADVRTMDQWVSRSLSQARFNSTLLTAFAIVALLLAAVGIYGVIAYAVTQRTHELGIRAALGASAGSLQRLVFRSGMKLAGLGLAIGFVASLGLSRLLQVILYGVGARDPLTIAVVALVLGAVAAAACFVPARRATKVDPIVALRYQ